MVEDDEQLSSLSDGFADDLAERVAANFRHGLFAVQTQKHEASIRFHPQIHFLVTPTEYTRRVLIVEVKDAPPFCSAAQKGFSPADSIAERQRERGLKAARVANDEYN